MTRQQYQYLDHCLRLTWRHHGTNIEKAVIDSFDSFLYGHATFSLGDTLKPHTS